MEDIQYAFIDEWGTYGFDFDQDAISTHFIIAAILVKDSDKKILEQEMERIFQKADLHTIDHNQRLQLLNELKDLPFTIYAYAIDKRKIREDSGIMYKKTFLKFLNKKIYDDLYRTFERLDLVVDENGTKDFMKEFKSYVLRESIPDLFHYSSFGFNESQSEVLLQLAEFIAGTIAIGYDLRQYSEQYPTFYKAIKNRIIGINLWPYDVRHFLYEYDKPDSNYDEVIIKQSVHLAYQYIDKYRKSNDEDELLRMDLLKFLLYNLKETPNEYVYTQEILDNLNAIRDVKLTQHTFRATIVSKLRDQGILIASSNKGYKLPASLADLYDFVNLSSLTIHPMIQRISKCREQILLATNNEIDILEKTEYEYLKSVIEMEKKGIHFIK